jgi:hypothetical protein
MHERVFRTKKADYTKPVRGNGAAVDGLFSSLGGIEFEIGLGLGAWAASEAVFIEEDGSSPGLAVRGAFPG